MAEAPVYLKDAKDLLTAQGFATSDVWYHGTSSALVEPIKAEGIKRSGDRAIKDATKKTMATIGNNYSESTEPVFLTQSKELAYYWAEQTVRERSVRFEGEEQPVVFAVTLPADINAKVKPDVGAASLLLLKEGESFMAHLAAIYEVCDGGILDIDLMKADRMEYLTALGMAYLDEDISASHIALVTE